MGTLFLPANVDACACDCSGDDYHADDDWINQTAIEEFRACPRHYAERFIWHSRPKREQTDAMRLGSALHAYGLERQEFLANWFWYPQAAADGEEWNFRLKAHRLERDAFYAAANGRHISQEEMAEVATWWRSLEAHELIGELLAAPGHAEQTFLWIDPATGLPCKCRCDKWIPDRRIIVDIKTTEDASPAGFRRDARARGHHRTAAWYRWGVSLAEPDGGQITYIFACVDKNTHQAAAYILDETDVARGDLENRGTLAAMAVCAETGDWRAPFERRLQRISLGGWSD